METLTPKGKHQSLVMLGCVVPVISCIQQSENSRLGTWEVAQELKWWTFKHEDLSLGAAPLLKLGVAVTSVTQVLGLHLGRDGRVLRLTGQPI